MTASPQPLPFWLPPQPVNFPPTQLALNEPDGLLAVGGALNNEWLLQAYSRGIFPWFNPGEPILWWTPNPRSVLFIADLKIARSLRQSIKKYTLTGHFRVSFDEQFSQVMQACAQVPRAGQDGTWISQSMLEAYANLHESGHAHSVEVWEDNQLIGGLYGVGIGKMFFGESMFAKKTDASKIALVALALQLNEWNFKLIDVQVETAHLNRLGAQNISRAQFENLIEQMTQQAFKSRKWQLSNTWQNWITPHIEQQKQQKKSI